VIPNSADKTAEDIFHGRDSRAARSIPRVIWKVAARKLDMLNAAYELRDLRTPPANRLEALKGRMTGYYSIRVNEQFRVIFQWADGNARDVQIIDYH